MAAKKLLKIKEETLEDKIRFLVGDTLSFIIEIFEEKKLEDLAKDTQKVAELKMYSSFPNDKKNPLIKSLKDNNGKRIEYNDAAKILREYYNGGKRTGEYKNKIIEKIKKITNNTEEDTNNTEKKKEFEDFSKNAFIKEFDYQCNVENTFLIQLGTSRNNFAHSVEPCETGFLFIWINELVNYIENFLSYRMQVLARYDEKFGKKEDIERLNELLEKANGLKNDCYVSNKEYKIFKFGKDNYKFIEDSKAEIQRDFPILIMQMAKEWMKGIEYLRNQKRSEQFCEFYGCYCNDDSKVLDIENKIIELTKSVEDSVSENTLYASILYRVYPMLPGLWWKGKRYSESYFASMTLQILTRHPGTYSFTGKANVLKDRIENFVEWDTNNESGKKGLGINLVMFCKEGILSNYFRGRKLSTKQLTQRLLIQKKWATEEDGRLKNELSIASKQDRETLRQEFEGNQKIIITLENRVAELTNEEIYAKENKKMESAKSFESAVIESWDVNKNIVKNNYFTEAERYDKFIFITQKLTDCMKEKKSCILSRTFDKSETKPTVFENPKDLRTHFVSLMKIITNEKTTYSEQADYIRQLAEYMSDVKNDNSLRNFLDIKQQDY